MQRVAVGLSLREPWLDDLETLPDRGGFEVLEVMVDDYLCDHGPRRRVRRLGTRWVLVAHGVALGIGDAAGVDEAYVRDVHAALRALAARWWSDHLAFLRAGGVDLGHFAPVGDDDETMQTLRRNATAATRGAPCPLLLENASDVLGLGADGPDAGAKLGRGYRRALEIADAGSLLDLTNLWIDSQNGGWDPRAWLDAIPLERVVQVHLAGGRRARGLWIDSHDRAIHDEALALLAELAPRAPNLRAVTLEWDEDIPPLAAVREELSRATAVLAEAGRR